MYTLRGTLLLLLIGSCSAAVGLSGEKSHTLDVLSTRKTDSINDEDHLFLHARYQPSDNIQMGCKELRSKKYISDGFCTSVKPITEVVCSGNCLPIDELPWYAEYAKVWARSKADEWRCVDDVVIRKRVHLVCQNGERRTYKIKVVKSCKCKKYKKPHNKTSNRNRRKSSRDVHEESEK